MQIFGRSKMKDGFVKVAAFSPEVRVADCSFNAARICDGINKAFEDGCKVVVFPELSVCGYTAGDLFLQSTLTDSVEKAVETIKDHCVGRQIFVAVGAPVAIAGKLYNCAIAIYDGKILGIVPKRNVPSYAEFYEGRYFESGEKLDNVDKTVYCGDEVDVCSKAVFRCRNMRDFCIGIEICEDMWIAGGPADTLCAAGATIICNLSASDETVGKDDYRILLVKSASGKCNCGYVYCDCGDGESSTDLVFSAHDMIAENGTILAESEPFAGGYAVSEIDVAKLVSERIRQNTAPSEPLREIYFDCVKSETRLTRKVDKTPFVPSGENDRSARCDRVFEIQARGLAKRMRHTNCKHLVIGLSGGLDSALALLVACRAVEIVGLERSNITALTMPCFGTTKRTRSNAEKLARALGTKFAKVDISKTVKRHFADIGHDGVTGDVAFENAQARERTQVLMDFANMSGGLVVGTGDLSELALGWATYNGDHMSMYGVNGSVPKTLVRHLVRYYAENYANLKAKRALEDILDTPVSPELIPAKDGEIAQKTEEIVGPYELHDFFLYNIVRWGFSPSKTFRLAKYAFDGDFDDATIYKWLKTFVSRFFAQQFKRSCLPDGPKVGSVDLSPRGGWRMPSDACKEEWIRDLETCDPSAKR